MSDHRTQIGRWYRHSRWARKARNQLRSKPLCAICERAGVVMPAEIADHVIPHKGDYKLFWFGQLQSLCKHHHDGTKKQLENAGYVRDIGDDGYPIDGAHPFNAKLTSCASPRR